MPRACAALAGLCGLPTREEAEAGAEVSVARQQEITGQFTSLTKQRREVLGNPERLESLALTPGSPHVQLIASPKNRSKASESSIISNTYENLHGLPVAGLDDPYSLKMLRHQAKERRLDILNPKTGQQPKAILDTLR